MMANSFFNSVVLGVGLCGAFIWLLRRNRQAHGIAAAELKAVRTQSQERLDLGIRVAGLALADVDYYTGLTHLSAESARQFGLGESAAVVSRAQVHATFHPDDRAELMPLIAASLDPTGEGWFKMDHRVVLQTGEVRWLRVRKQVFFDGEGSARRPMRAILATYDVTPEKVAEERLRLFEKVITTMHDVVMIAEAAPLDEPGPRIAYVNPAFTQMTGYTAAESIGRSPRFLHGPKTSRLVRDKIRAALQNGEPVKVEVTDYRKDGAEIEVEFEILPVSDTDGVLSHWVSIQREITERKKAEAAMRAGQERMRLATESTGVGIWEWNILTNRIRWDAQMFRLYGVPPTADGIVPYETWSRAVLPEDLAHQEKVLQDTLRRQGQSSREFRIVRADDGQTCTVTAIEMARTNLDGKTEWMVGSNLDVTERKLVAQKLREAKEAAESANRSKDRFLAILSHELRTPLTPVLLTVSALEHDSELRPAVREEMTMIRRNIEMETKLIDDLLDVSRIASGKLELHIEQLDLNSAVEHVCSLCMPQIVGQEVLLTLDLCPEAGFIHADPARFEQVIWNVLKNAVKFTPRKGKIHITSLRHSPTRVEVCITDNGVGITPEVLPRIFDAFEQGDFHITRQFGGLGLGLAISKALIELHGGTIRAQSGGTGRGASFMIEVPSMEQENLTSDSPGPVEKAVPTGLRLLIVEDHADTARALKLLLSQDGFSVTTACDVASALALAETETFDLLISDLGLPDASGYELMMRIQAIQPLPGLAMSGYGMEGDVRQSLAAGFSEHLVKPVKIPQLVEAIQRLFTSEEHLAELSQR